MAFQGQSWKFAGPVYSRSISKSSQPVQDCDVCLNLQLESSGNDDDRLVRVDYYRLAERGVYEDCPYCSLIYFSLGQHGASIPETGYSIVSISAAKDQPIFLCWDDARKGRSYLEIYRAEDSRRLEYPYDFLGTSGEIASDPQDPILLDKVRYWIDWCNENHTNCQKTRETPLRLVYIGEEPESVVRVEENLKDIPYVALSHCWGQARDCISTKENLPNRRLEIPWSELPPTFQDAITVTRGLGLRYVWIDSLCILQNDRSDWETESAHMGQVYEDAWICLSAACSFGDEYGFLRSNSLRSQYTSHELSFEYQTTSFFGIRIRETHDIRDIVEPDPLNTRGWTLQERLLSRRILTFTSTSITFECVENHICECGDGFYPNPFSAQDIAARLEVGDKQLYFERLNPDPLVAQLASDAIKEQAQEYWRNSIVSNYSARSLTKPEDYLPAISAIAQKFKDFLKDDYLAGIWKEDLIKGLSWHVRVYDRPDRTLRQPVRSDPTILSFYRAPSFSWASIVGVFRHWTDGRNWALGTLLPYANLIEFNLEPRGSDITGELKSGYIRLHAPTVPALFTVNEVSDGQFQWFIDKSIISLKEGHQLSRAWSNIMIDTPVKAIDALDEHGDPYGTVARSEQSAAEPTSSITGRIVLALLAECPIRGYDGHIIRFFLILGGHPAIPGAYQRIGCLEIRKNSEPASGDRQYWLGGFEDSVITIY